MLRWPLAFLALSALPAAALRGAVAPPPPDFPREVRPVLAENCFKCHGMDKSEHRLRLDLREAALKGGKSGLPAIVPGKPEDSELIERITSTDDDEKMPPPDSHKTLSPAQIDLLRRWIKAGAVYRPHWAFVAPVRPAPPKVRNARWPRNPIDRFVLAGLEREKLSPSPAADGVTLCRRLYLDLVGLPPTPLEVDRFAAHYARAPDEAVGRLVEDLLASPHYGEKWARPWLDAARYADSNGYEKDRERTVWPYRDYVIDAFNRDLPYDRFIVEQLAGDLLPNPTPDQIAATAFIRLSMLNEEGAIDPEEYRMVAMFDRMDALGKSVLGLTINCAQCHNHKYDPLPQEDYYRLFAFLNNDYDANPAYYTRDQRQAVADLRGAMATVEASMRAKLPGWEERLATWEEERRAAEPAWQTVSLENTGDNSQRYERLPDGSLLAGGWPPPTLTAKFKFHSPLGRITALRLEMLNHPDLPDGGPGRSYQGLFALSEFGVEVASAGPADPAGEAPAPAAPTPTAEEKASPARRRVKLASAVDDLGLSPSAFVQAFGLPSDAGVGPAAFAIDGDSKTAWSSDIGPGRRNEERAAVFRTADPLVVPAGGDVFITLDQTTHRGSDSQDLGRFRLQVTDAATLPEVALSRAVIQALAVPRARRTAEQEEAIFRAWSPTVPEWKEENARLAELWRRWPEHITTYALQRRDVPRATHLLERGDWLKPTREVKPGVPHFLNPPLAGGDGTRLELARWITDPKAPLTARVFVNRVWQAYFGVGLVATAEDFGLQSPPPSNPELLDWLACEFMVPSEPGVAPWSIKHLQRLIATSATYRQSSRVTPALLALDPENRLLARGPRFRVDGEIIRDIALSASGLLNPKIGGRSVMPPAPEDLFQPPASYEPFAWTVEEGDGKYRRALYTFRRRSTPYPMLQVFDTPSGETSCVRRFRSNTPLQALTLLNEPVFMDCAIALARRTLEEAGGDDDAHVSQAFRFAVSRPPDRDERGALVSLLRRQRQRYARGELDPTALLSKNLPPPIGVSYAEWASLAVVSRAILDLDETISKE
jgi:hypothetical protein